MLKALLTDIDGTITDPSRRINTGAIDTIRSLVDTGIEVILASGNTACFMDALCKMIGTRGSFIAENGGVYRSGFTGTLQIHGDLSISKNALAAVQQHFQKTGTELDLYSPDYRFSDRAFARTVSPDEVRKVLSGFPVQVIDTGYAIHIQLTGINKGTALKALGEMLAIDPSDIMAIGDSVNDVPMLAGAGIGIAVANAHPDVKKIATYITRKEYGDGFVEAVEKYRSYFRAR
ncbi:MAG: Phosphoglycolate phosphatase [Methanoregula sp. PtaU1.Bin051]|nr:MAG: Phosphoglycolate phosphatase [Methanoregula sp. PtaU1.Bin051]